MPVRTGSGAPETNSRAASAYASSWAAYRAVSRACENL